MIFLSCGDGNMVVDEVGFSDFIAQNNLNFDVTIVTQPDSTVATVPASTSIFLAQEVAGDFGVHAFPKTIFTSVAIYLGSTDSLLYLQQPVADSLWQHQTPGGYSWWERAEYTLIINDNLIQP